MKYQFNILVDELETKLIDEKEITVNIYNIPTLSYGIYKKSVPLIRDKFLIRRIRVLSRSFSLTPLSLSLGLIKYR